MKKIILLSSLLLLAACNSKEEPATNSSSSQQSSAATATSTTEATETPASSETAAAETPAALSQLAAEYPDHRFPSDVPYDESKQLSFVANIEEQNEAILYYALDEQFEPNADELHAQTPFAGYYKTVYGTAEEAKEAVGKQIASGAAEVDLGYGITGYQEGAAGSAYLMWEEGNWTFSIRASNVEDQEPVEKAKEIVTYLEEAALPAPNTDGQVNIDMVLSDMTAARVNWQEDNVVYTTSHQDALSALRMAVSMNR